MAAIANGARVRYSRRPFLQRSFRDSGVCELFAGDSFMVDRADIGMTPGISQRNSSDRRTDGL
jgi:hypothetical protein